MLPMASGVTILFASAIGLAGLALAGAALTAPSAPAPNPARYRSLSREQKKLVDRIHHCERNLYRGQRVVGRTVDGHQIVAQKSSRSDDYEVIVGDSTFRSPYVQTAASQFVAMSELPCS